MATREQQAQALAKEWSDNSRWNGIKRNYTAEDVVRLRGSVMVEHTLAKRGSEKLWNLMHTEPFVNALGALTGNQAMQQVKAGLKAIYLSGWQVAGDAFLVVVCRYLSLKQDPILRSVRLRQELMANRFSPHSKNLVVVGPILWPNV